jgi:hypothetical protein
MSLYEKVLEIAASKDIDGLYNELGSLLADQNRRILIPKQSIQAVEIYQDIDYVMLVMYLVTVEVVIKIYKDDTISMQIYYLYRCDCG